MKAEGALSEPRPQFNFVLRAEFPLNALVLATEALRIANQNSGRALFGWSRLSEDGQPVRASNGMWFAVDAAVSDAPAAEVWLVFEGNLPTRRGGAALSAALRQAARAGAVLGGVDTGAFALAQAGLAGADAHAAVALHWEARPTFEERFPDAEIRDQIYLLEGARAYAAGGVATLDLTLALIERFHGAALANEVANALVHSRRPADAPQRADAARPADRGGLASRAVALMESRIEEPLSLDEIAAALRVSPRTVSRACQRLFGEAPMRLYLQIRLQAARNFLFYDDLSVVAVALACGFSSPEVFARAFSRRFGLSPSAFRAELRRAQSAAIRPEIRRLAGAP
jgi:transcriptional regulator GlxA family with amidase domain